MASNIIKLRNIKRAFNIKAADLKNNEISYIISGRVDNFRPYKSFNFIDLTDGSTKNHLQLIVKRNLLKKPELGSYLTCLGNLVESPGKGQSIEFKVEEIKYLGGCDPEEYPLAVTNVNPSYNWYRSLPHLRPRAKHFASLLRVRSELELCLHMIMKQMDFFRVHTPSLSGNDSEASGDLFIVKRTKMLGREVNQDGDNFDEQSDSGYQSDYSSDDNDGSVRFASRLVKDDYFHKDVFLVTSAQLHLENLVASLSRVYTLSTAFRAENSKSTTHLCEFTMFEAEEANVNTIEPLMTRVESIIKFVGQYVAEVSEHSQDLNSLVELNDNQENLSKLIDKPYVRMNYREALDILGNRVRDFHGSTKYGCDIGRAHERKLLEYCDNVPIFITNYPKQLKPFYMKCDEKDVGENQEALCFDLIVPQGGELCGGSLREDNLEKLMLNLDKLSTKSEFAMAAKHKQEPDNKDQFDWYLDSRRFGSFPHGGFGIGFERLLQAILGFRNIKDTTAFPRWVGHCPM